MDVEVRRAAGRERAHLRQRPVLGFDGERGDRSGAR